VTTLDVDEEEEFLRNMLETAVTAGIDLFQQVDKQQLSLLGATTDLTGPMVERLIERYVTEQLHGSDLFPVLRRTRRMEDQELESRIHGMQYIDITQVGIEVEGGRNGKDQLVRRLTRGVEEFRQLGVASGPQQMLEILVKTQKVVTSDEPARKDNKKTVDDDKGSREIEKILSTMTMNADTLVSLLLVVVIRSHVRHLHARLAYMRNFIFVEDVESGETGYALSTFEAVLSYLVTDSGGLRKASRRNKRLWQATKEGDVLEIKKMLDPRQASDEIGEGSPQKQKRADEEAIEDKKPDNHIEHLVERAGGDLLNSHAPQEPTEDGYTSEGSTLAHVFPFQTPTPVSPTRRGKRVSMDTRSFSNSSELSFISRTTTLDSRSGGIEGDTSTETLVQTQDTEGNSILMMAVEARQPGVLGYLLSLEEHFPTKFVLEDSNQEGTTLLSAAVQIANAEMIDLLLCRIFQAKDQQEVTDYFAKADNRDRTVAHYLFNAPYLIPRFCDILPWRKKDRNGQTPLLALCRSYDHPEYSEMVNDSLQFATHEQGDGQPLHLDDHVDAKGNTLLHVVNDPSLAVRILRHCDSDANATNDKHFTPLMVASKYGRMDMVRALFGDKRVDIHATESRGMTAVELAKDDEIRNRIDDMILVSNVPAPDGRVTAVVRSFFVEDASIRLIIKSAVRNDNGMIGVTTCRRSLTDFENLVKWLALEHPASWLPSIFNFRSPLQIPSRPSRAVLQDIQVRLDNFLKIMLAHSTFSTHELVWEFILFPEIQPDMMAERSRKKAEIRNENIREDYEPVEDVREISTFAEHARESIRGVNHSTKSVIRRSTSIRVGLSSTLDVHHTSVTIC
jgi:ankyrin repeat protein